VHDWEKSIVHDYDCFLSFEGHWAVLTVKLLFNLYKRYKIHSYQVALRKHRKRVKLSQRSFPIIFPAQNKDSRDAAHGAEQTSCSSRSCACNKAALLSFLFFFPTRTDARAPPDATEALTSHGSVCCALHRSSAATGVVTERQQESAIVTRSCVSESVPKSLGVAPDLTSSTHCTRRPQPTHKQMM
jgi:hypothetical protein